MWGAIEIVLIVLGLVIAYVGFKLNIPVLQDLGIASLGLLSIVIGWEAIITRRIAIGSRRHGSRRLYTGPAAMMQGAQFNILGFSLSYLVSCCFSTPTLVRLNSRSHVTLVGCW